MSSDKTSPNPPNNNNNHSNSEAVSPDSSVSRNELRITREEFINELREFRNEIRELRNEIREFCNEMRNNYITKADLQEAVERIILNLTSVITSTVTTITEALSGTQ